jgi:hypothetical protein
VLYIPRSDTGSWEATWVPPDDFAQLQLQLVDPTQWRYEVIRPLVLLADRTPRQRADETDTHPATVRTLTRRFRQQGMLGLLPEDVQVSVRARMPRVPGAVREEVDRLEALYDGFRYRELAGCVTLHSYHFYVEAGLPQTQVLLWVAGTQLRAAFDHVILAEHHCRYDWRDRRVKDVRPGVFHLTRFASSQGTLLPLTPHGSLVVYRTRARRRPPARSSTPQLVLFEVVPTS